MSLSSLNTRDSALSPHALSIMRPLLRRIVLSHRDCVGEIKSETDADFDVEDFDTEDTPGQASAERLDALALPLELRINAPYSATPAASLMSSAEIAEALSEGHDPWAEEAETFRNGRVLQPPIRIMAIAARFVALFQTAALIDEMTSRRAMTRIEVGSAEDRKALYTELARILPWLSELSELSEPLEDTWGFIDVTAWGEHEADSKTRAEQRRTDYEKTVASAVREGRKVICLVPAGAPMSAVERAVSERTVQLPPLTVNICIELLRATHTATGELAEDELRKRLPTSAELSELPLAVVEGAFRERTTIAVADALALSARRLRTPSGTTLEDIVLNADVEEHVDRLVHDLELWKAEKLGWKDVSSSILLYGPPGNGKTLLAAALSGSLDAQLIATSYSDCQKHGHQGDMLRALSDKVEEAIRMRPSVFFLDELDSFTQRNAPKRNSDYIIGVVNGLLEHLSRLNETPGIIVLGATNHPETVDPAIIRPGRFDVHLEIGNPDRNAILKIFSHALGRTDGPIDVGNVADNLLGSSGAQVVALVKEAKGLARRDGLALEKRHLVVVSDRIRRPLDSETEWRTAVHEAGHLVVAHYLNLPAPVKATMSRFGGLVDVPSRLLESRQTARDRIAALLGGRAAEIVVLGEALNGAGIGAQSDLAFATKIAEKALYEWGLGDQLAYTPLSLVDSGTLQPSAIKQVDALLNEQQERAIWIADQHQDDIVRIGRALLKERELSAEELSDLLMPIQKRVTPREPSAAR